jgi:16S rRNA (guanine527-N7)-methyltransferase
MEAKRVFHEFLQEHAPDRASELMVRFEEYHLQLTRVNREINLISRKMPEEEYWTVHYLDSLLPVTKFDFAGCRLLDFGTGGGLPGIPLALWEPGCEVTLLDSKLKKISALKKIVNLLDLHNCTPFASRLEEYPRPEVRFNFVVCRSVRFEPAFRPHFVRMLTPAGRLLYYKAHDESDLADLPEAERFDLSHPAVGTRILVSYRRKALGKP